MLSIAMLWKNKITKIGLFLLIFLMLVSWIFSGWPQVWQNPSVPPRVEKAQASPGDFKIIRGTSIVPSGSGSVTITESADYTLESGVTINDAFIRITNARLTGGGRTSGGGNQNTDDFTVRIDNPENLLTSINFTHVGTAMNSRVDWEIIQYVGSAGGANEIIVRATSDIATSGTTASVTGTTVTTISDINAVIPFITSQSCNDTGRADWFGCLFTGSMVANASDWDPTFTRGKSDPDVGRVSYAVVEFTGSNWKDVQRISTATKPTTAWAPGSDAYSDLNITDEGGSNLSDASKAFLHIQYMTDDDNTGISHAGDTWQLLSATQLRLRSRYLNNTQTSVIWIIENTQSSGTVMSVEHIYFYDSTTSGSEEYQWTQAVTAVSLLDESSIMGETSSVDGSEAGRAYPRGAINIRLTAVDMVTLTESDIGQERHIAFDVVQWPTESGNSAPLITSVSLNSGSDITLNEGTWKSASTTIAISDADFCTDILSVTATLYRAPTSTPGTTCAPEDGDCYREEIACTATTTGDTCGASDTTVEYDCGFHLWYIASPTDAGTYMGDVWAVSATTTDAAAATATATNTQEIIEVISLNALDVTSSISYGTVVAGANTGSTNQETTVTNTGNTAIDTQVDSQGTDMCSDYPTCAGNTFVVTSQEFSLTSGFTWSAGTNLTDAIQELETNIIKPTSTTTDQTDIIYWGIGIPGATAIDTYTGQTNFTAKTDD